MHAAITSAATHHQPHLAGTTDGAQPTGRTELAATNYRGQGSSQPTLGQPALVGGKPMTEQLTFDFNACKATNCNNPIHARGLCKTHFAGSSLIRFPTTTPKRRKRKPTQRIDKQQFWDRVDRSNGPDACWIWTGCVDKRWGYGHFSNAGESRLAHQIAWELETGKRPPRRRAKYELDHICHERTCVNPAHLRLVTRKQNQENRAGPRRDNAAGVRGVTAQANGRWLAQVVHNQQLISLGTFDTLEEANDAACAKRLELFTHNVEDRARFLANNEPSAATIPASNAERTFE